MRIRTLVAAVGCAGLLGLAAPAQDPGKLPADVVPSSFRAHLVTDGRFPPLKKDGKEEPDPRNRTGKIHCLVCEHGLAPVIAIFVRTDAKNLGPDGEVAKLIKAVDAFIPKYRSDKLASFAMFLRLEGGTKVVTVKLKQPDGTEVENKVEQDLEYPDDEKRDVYAKDIQDFAAALNTTNVPFGLAAEKSKALTAWGVKDADEVTVIVYYRMRIIGKPWAFGKVAEVTPEKIAEILKTAEATITGKK